MTEPGKRLLPRLIACLDRRIWAAHDASARAAGLTVRKVGWRRRVYRDPRFDRLRDVRAGAAREAAESPFRPG